MNFTRDILKTGQKYVVKTNRQLVYEWCFSCSVFDRNINGLYMQYFHTHIYTHKTLAHTHTHPTLTHTHTSLHIHTKTTFMYTKLHEYNIYKIKEKYECCAVIWENSRDRVNIVFLFFQYCLVNAELQDLVITIAYISSLEQRAHTRFEKVLSLCMSNS